MMLRQTEQAVHTIYATATEMIGTTTHKDSYGEKDACIQELLEEKHHIHRPLLNDLTSTSNKAAYSNIRGKFQKVLHQM